MTAEKVRMSVGSSWSAAQAEQYLREQQQRYAKLREDGERVRQQLGETTATATGGNGAVTVTVGAGGVMRRIRFGARAQQLPAGQLATAVMAAYAQACREAAEQGVQVMSQLVGPDSPSLQVIRDAIPPAAEDEEPAR